MKKIALIITVLVAAVVLLFLATSKNAGMEGDYETPVDASTEGAFITTNVDVPEGLEVATFAAGCFWCTEAVFQETTGVEDVVSGYAGDQEQNPTYEQVYTHSTGHREAVQFFFDPDVITYSEILDILWQAIDPTDAGGQFVDRGFAYTAAVFYHNDTQKQQIEMSIESLAASDRFDKPIVTKVLPFTTFYMAEDYHQDFYLNASDRYKQYESNSGREEYRDAIWQDIMSQ